MTYRWTPRRYASKTCIYWIKHSCRLQASICSHVKCLAVYLVRVDTLLTQFYRYNHIISVEVAKNLLSCRRCPLAVLEEITEHKSAHTLAHIEKTLAFMVRMYNKESHEGSGKAVSFAKKAPVTLSASYPTSWSTSAGDPEAPNNFWKEQTTVTNNLIENESNLGLRNNHYKTMD